MRLQRAGFEPAINLEHMARRQALRSRSGAHGIRGFLNEQGLITMNPDKRRQPTLEGGFKGLGTDLWHGEGCDSGFERRQASQQLLHHIGLHFAVQQLFFLLFGDDLDIGRCDVAIQQQLGRG